MICGYCFTEMKSGILTSNGNRLEWEPDSISPNLLTKDIENGLDFNNQESNCELRAYICPNCHKIIIDLDRLNI